jgi:hypothetical protein
MPGFGQVGREGEKGESGGKNFFFPCYVSREEEA